jgi:teichoic acid transport system permease protein
VYEPHRVGLPPLGSYFRELWRRREFAYELARTDMRAQHLDTNFGRLWLLLNPLLLAGVYFILVDIIRRGGAHREHNYLEHLVLEIFAYYFVSGAIRSGARTVVGGGKLVLNTAFPRLLLPLASVLEHFLRFLPTLAIYAVIHVAAGLEVGPHLLLVIPLVILLTGIGAGLSMFVSALQVYFRDLTQFLPYMLRLWLYLSPVLWTVHQIDKVGYHFLVWVNPLGPPLVALSDIVIEGYVPGPELFAASAAWAVVLLLVGSVFFMSRERDFAVRL